MKNRIEYVSVLRVLAMLSVVWYHCICGYSDIWPGKYVYHVVGYWNQFAHMLTYFHMPLFVIISGFLYRHVSVHNGYPSFKIFCKKKFYRCFIPYLFWSFFVCIVQGYSYRTILEGTAHLWFLLLIFQAFMVYYVIEHYMPEYLRKILCLGCLAILPFSMTLIFHLGGWLPFGMNNFIKFFPYFVVGTLLYDFLDSCMWRKGIMLCFAVCSITVFLVLYFFTVKYYFLSVPSLFFILAVFYLCSIRKYHHLNSCILCLDAYCMGIYILHHIFIQEMNASLFCKELMAHTWWYPIVQFCIVLAISWGGTYLLLRWKITKLLIGS